MRYSFRRVGSRAALVLAISALAGAPMATFGCFQLFQAYRLYATAERADGVVVALRKDGERILPVVRFAAQGYGIMRVSIAAQDIALGAEEYREGQTVAVLYPAFAPEKARLYAPRHFWLAPSLTTAAGILPLLVGGIVAWFVARKERRNPAEQPD